MHTMRFPCISFSLPAAVGHLPLPFSGLFLYCPAVHGRYPDFNNRVSGPRRQRRQISNVRRACVDANTSHSGGAPRLEKDEPSERAAAVSTDPRFWQYGTDCKRDTLPCQKRGAPAAAVAAACGRLGRKVSRGIAASFGAFGCWLFSH